MYSLPTVKTLDVLEFLAESRQELTLARIAQGTGVTPATLMRILNVLVDYGYLRRDRDKRYLATFRLEKLNAMTPETDRLLDLMLQRLVDGGASSAEFLTVRGDQLCWHKKAERPDQEIRVIAQPGFRRTIYELDAPSRLYLRHLGAEKAAAKFDPVRFYDTAYVPCDWTRAAELFMAEAPDGVSCDPRGNSNGIRRYAILLGDGERPPAGLLTVAEAAVPVNDTPEHRQRIVDLLLREKKYFAEGQNSKGA